MITHEQYNMLLNMLSKASTSETSALVTGNECLLLNDGKVGSVGNVQMPT